MDPLQAILILVFLGVMWLAPKKSVNLMVFLGLAAVLSAAMPYGSDEHIITNAMALDSFVCVAMYFCWSIADSMRCYAIGFIGLAKNALSFAFLSTGMAFSWDVYAYLIAFAFLAQVLTAGGLLNNVGSWLDNMLFRLAPKRHSLLRNHG